VYEPTGLGLLGEGGGAGGEKLGNKRKKEAKAKQVPTARYAHSSTSAVFVHMLILVHLLSSYKKEAKAKQVPTARYAHSSTQVHLLPLTALQTTL
jgi:hypothetical protein